MSLRRSDEREILMDNKTTRRGDSGPEERAETATRAACGLRHGKQMLAACWVSRGGYRGADLSHSARADVESRRLRLQQILNLSRVGD